MAKWIYERWSIKWDDTGFTPMTTTTQALFIAKVDIVTMVASEANEVAVGDAALSNSTNINEFNSGEDVYIMYVTSVSRSTNGSYVGKYKFKSGVGANKEWLANQRIKNERQADVILEDGTVPDNGIHTDGFWYVKVKKAFPTMRILRDGQWVEVETGYVLKNGYYYYYVRSNGQLVVNATYWVTNTNGLLPEGSYEFGADGKMINPPTTDPDEPGDPTPEIVREIVEEGGVLYYYENGVKTYAGLIYLDGYGVWKPIEEIYKLQGGKWVQA